MSTQALTVLDWLVDTWSAVIWPVASPVTVVDGPPQQDVSEPLILFVGWDGQQPAEADSAVAPESWAFLGNPASRDRDETISIPCVLAARRGDHNLRSRRAEVASLLDPIAQAIRDANAWQGPPGSSVLWLALSGVTVWQAQTTKGAAILVHFTVEVRARA